MNENQNTEVTKLTVDSLGSIPMLAVMEHSSIPWAIKDNTSRFVYINKSCLNLFDIHTGFDFEGCLDEDMPCAWSEYSQEFKAQDRKAESNKNGSEIIVTSYFGREKIMEPWYFPKFPIYNSTGEVLGTIFYGKKFSFISISEFFNNLKPSVVNLTPPVDTFTEKELDIIFYAFQKLSEKDIATKLCLSHRTVENRLQRIYDKMGVNSLSGLVEYCHTTGLNNYVPKKLLREGVEFFW
ncbi:helix-turn-helix transcriptional regulator [Candidatus Williamhamiltonella defendens]|uniref:Helix-turn-helix transcriptional regulator n=1 Tax=Candidatus Williamhamiltonella defendens TaxID=138072 RepID=A0A2D3T1G4_9ENTR|nr:PAS and helix-turn-helix domain-containing protein [Candidatus Hamiltonella defensa]ATW29658.1 helix-turn-helix transcriptional regulator [Candidatus Hamiltonella defensa]ATW31636.1 helix-turn-helix transcriptional regulator [Candidatus Hamiltonella defensa]